MSGLAECIYADGLAEVWHADCLHPGVVEHVMGARVADAMIVDAPYSERTHAGHSRGKMASDRAANEQRRDLSYAAWSPATVDSFVDLWAPHVNGWSVSLTDHVLAPHWESAFGCNGLLAFSPLAFVVPGSRVRIAGDGPSQWAVWCAVARPRNALFAAWGSLPGAYIVESNTEAKGNRVVGGKPLSGMLQIVRDYSRSGALVVDPCCGAGTTLVAAKQLGRRSIGIDRDRAHAMISARRLADTRHQPGLFAERTKAGPLMQAALFAGEET